MEKSYVMYGRDQKKVLITDKFYCTKVKYLHSEDHSSRSF